MPRTCWLLGALCVLSSPLLAQLAPDAEVPPPAAAGARYDASVRSPAAELARPLGAEVSLHSEIQACMRALAESSPKVERFVYGRSLEGRELACLVVASPENLARLAAVRSAMQRLSDPRELSAADEQQLLATTPAVAWLAYCVHGDEPSGSEACLQLAYHLAAAQDDPVVTSILRECVVVLDPLQNPDGRDRFVHGTRAARGILADDEPAAAEHSQPWPGGRWNHALFDMNRDWFAQTQPETAARVRAFLEWMPLVYADVHEMGGESSYYFAPPARPLHPEITDAQRQWLLRYGRNNAAWFDRLGYEYFTRDEYDSFYPGYGEGWPTFHGAIGMTFEMASARGLVWRRRDESKVTLQDGIDRNFASSLATLQTLAEARREALLAFVDYRRQAVADGAKGDAVEYVLPSSGDVSRLRSLARTLVQNGVEVHVAASGLESEAARPLAGGEAAARAFPSGSLVVRLAQPNRLARVLLAPHFDMDQGFVDEQKARERRRQGLEFYDLTGWSLPLLFGLEAYACAAPSRGEVRRLSADDLDLSFPGRAPSQPPKVAYLIPWGQNGAGAMAVALLQAGASVRSLDRAFVHAGRRYPAGSLVVRPGAGPLDLHERIAALARQHGVAVEGADASWVDDGPDFGTNRSLLLRRPRVAMAWDRPVSPTSAGAARHLLERRYGLPVSAIRTDDLGRADLDRYTVLILPEGGDYGRRLGKDGAQRIRGFVERGGVLVAIGSATRWLCAEDVGLLSTQPEDRTKDKAATNKRPDDAAPKGEAKDGKPEAAAEPFSYEAAILPDKEAPAPTPGAIVRVRTDAEHWLAFGYDGAANVVHESDRIYTPLKLDRGTNVAVYDTQDRLLLSGFMFDATKEQLADKAWLVHEGCGKGHVIAFAEDPFVRCFAQGLDGFMLNAVLLTKGR